MTRNKRRSTRRTRDCRAAAARTLQQVAVGQSLNQCLPTALDAVDPGDRALLQELCYGCLRQYPRLCALLDQMLDKPLRDKDGDVISDLADVFTNRRKLNYVPISPNKTVASNTFIPVTPPRGHQSHSQHDVQSKSEKSKGKQRPAKDIKVRIRGGRDRKAHDERVETDNGHSAQEVKNEIDVIEVYTNLVKLCSDALQKDQTQSGTLTKTTLRALLKRNHLPSSGKIKISWCTRRWLKCCNPPTSSI